MNFYPLARIQLETIKGNKIKLQREYRQSRIMWAAEVDSLYIDLDIMGRRLDVALGNSAKWYQDIRLWFIIGAASGIWVVSQTLQMSF